MGLFSKKNKEFERPEVLLEMKYSILKGRKQYKQVQYCIYTMGGIVVNLRTVARSKIVAV